MPRTTDDPPTLADDSAVLAIPVRGRLAMAIERPARALELCSFTDVRVPTDSLTIRDVAISGGGTHCWIRLPEVVPERRSVFFATPLRYLDELGARGFERVGLVAVRTAYPHTLAGGERVA